MQRLKDHRVFGFALVVLVAAMIFINPLRETAMQDDWAYARTVRHLVATGSYQLDPWLSANMPFQAYWGAAFSAALGFSHSALRLSTIALGFVGLVACYGLAKAYGFGNSEAGLLALVLAVSPVAFQLTYTFMTDVPLMALMLAALWLYTLALQKGDSRLAFAGSVAAAAAILTRQFGMALLAGWGTLWLFDAGRWRSLKRYIVGAALPAGAAAWQLYVGSVHPNYAARFVFDAQRAYLSQPLPDLAGELLWRVLVIALYLAVFVAPLALAACFQYGAWLRQPTLRRRVIGGLYLSVLAVGGTVLINSQRPGGWALMPFLPWNLFVFGWGQVLLTGVTYTAGVLLLPLFARQVSAFRRLALPEKLTDLTAGWSLLLMLVFFQIGDEYLLVLLPFALFAAARQLRAPLAKHSRLIFAACLVALALVAGFTRFQLASSDADWRAADAMLAAGVAEAQVSTLSTWSGYHGAFEAYIAQREASLTDALDEYFVWLMRRYEAAAYVVTRQPESVPGRVVYTVDSDEHLLRSQPVYVVERNATP